MELTESGEVEGHITTSENVDPAVLVMIQYLNQKDLI